MVISFKDDVNITFCAILPSLDGTYLSRSSIPKLKNHNCGIWKTNKPQEIHGRPMNSVNITILSGGANEVKFEDCHPHFSFYPIDHL